MFIHLSSVLNEKLLIHDIFVRKYSNYYEMSDQRVWKGNWRRLRAKFGAVWLTYNNCYSNTYNKKQSICANKNAALKVLERTDNDNDAARLVMVMTMLSSRSVGWRGWETETESWEWNGIYICIWKRRFWDKLNFQEVAAQLSMNKFTTPQSSEVHRHWRVVLESKSIILIDARPSRCSRCRNFCCSIMPSICDLFGSVCAVHSVSAGSPLCRHCLLPLPLLSWYFSCFPQFFLFLFSLCGN